MKEKTLDKDTIVAYHSFVQQKIRSDLNGLGIGPAWLPCRLAVLFAIFAMLSLATGLLVIGLRFRHVYLIDWWAQFTGPVFIILFLLLAALATHLLIIAKRRANKYRNELFFRPIGDFGVAVVHKSNLQFEQETKPELKSGTTPNRGVLPNSAAYSEKRQRDGHENRGYDRSGERDRHGNRERRGEHHDDRDRRPRDDRDRRDNRDRRPRDDREKRDDRERRPHDRERRERDPREQERRARERKEREAMGDIDPREKEYRERKDRERRERDGREEREGKRERPENAPGEDSPRGRPKQEDHRTGRGAPKLPADSSGFVPADRIVLDADFGHPAEHMETSSRASESEL